MSDIPAADRAQLESALKQHFGFDYFLDGQTEAIWHVTRGRDVVLVMPTGAGKSLCYQLPALMLDGVTLVVSPLISLMKDQVDALQARGLPATFVNSTLSREELVRRLDGVLAGEYKLVYIAPERFRDRQFVEDLRRAEVSLIAVDEAHCISQWGHDFRPDYMRLRYAVEDWPEARLMALTATATPVVREDIRRELRLDGDARPAPAELVFGFARDNLFLRVARCPDHAAKHARVRAVIDEHGTGIVYCATRKNVEAVTESLLGEGRGVLMYHGGLADHERGEAQRRFMDKEVPVAVATNAFGMGIDRDDLRFVMHWDLPGSVEAYYQEIGRAGRDGEPAHCELLYNYADVGTQEFFIEGSNPTRATLDEVWRAVRDECAAGPITRSIPEWRAGIDSTRSDMAVGTCLAILERCGLVHRVRAGSTYTYQVPPHPNESVLADQYRILREKRARDEQKLKHLLRFLNHPRCRHAAILGYFGETPESPRCQRCDNCVRPADDSLPALNEEQWVVVQKVLSCVGHLNHRFGRRRIAEVLCGANTKAIRNFRLENDRTYGLLKEHEQSVVVAVIDELIREGCVEVSSGEYPVLSLSALGREVAWRRAEVRLRWPAARPTSGKSSGDSAVRVPVDAVVNPELFEALRAWRKQEAQRRRMPAFTVFTDRTLRAISASVPQSEAELEACWGVSDAKVRQFGEPVLRIVDEFRDP